MTTPQLLLFSILLTHLYVLFTALYNQSANHYMCAHLPLLLGAAAITKIPAGWLLRRLGLSAQQLF